MPFSVPLNRTVALRILSKAEEIIISTDQAASESKESANSNALKNSIVSVSQDSLAARTCDF